jgi:hypothetical protein
MPMASRSSGVASRSQLSWVLDATCGEGHIRRERFAVENEHGLKAMGLG